MQQNIFCTSFSLAKLGIACAICSNVLRTFSFISVEDFAETRAAAH